MSGEDFKKHFERTGLKIEKLCEILDVSRSSVTRWFGQPTVPLYAVSKVLYLERVINDGVVGALGGK